MSDAKRVCYECEGDILGVRALHVVLKLISSELILLLNLLVGKLHEKYVNDEKYVKEQVERRKITLERLPQESHQKRHQLSTKLSRRKQKLFVYIKII